jgi:hypothetical protein
MTAGGRFSSNTTTSESLEGTGRNMSHAYNGMPAAELSDVTWRKSKHSNPNGACVEVALLPEGEIAVRNSRFPTGPALVYTRAEITAFLAGAKDGEFDHMVLAASSGGDRLPAWGAPAPLAQGDRDLGAAFPCGLAPYAIVIASSSAMA